MPIARSDQVRVFDPQDDALLATIPVFRRAPKALAVSADAAAVYADAHRSGNRTFIIPEGTAPPPPEM